MGTIDQQAAVHAVILNHMSAIEGRLRRGFFPPCYADAQSYIEGTRMNRDRTWGSDCEMITMADLLNTTIYSHDTANNVWAPYTPAGGIDPTVPAFYLQFINGNHFNVVTSVLSLCELFIASKSHPSPFYLFIVKTIIGFPPRCSSTSTW